jgi:hypothetical protein
MDSLDIITMVEYEQNKSNIVAASSLIALYSSRILSYLSQIQQILNDGFDKFKDQPYFHKVYTSVILTYIEPSLRDDFIRRKNNFDKLYTEIMQQHNDFVQKSPYVDLDLAFNILTKLSNVFCLMDAPKTLKMNHDNTYPLPNYIGIFGINSYLYGYFNNVHVVGFPLALGTYDGFYNCSYGFASHDLSHVAGMLYHKDYYDENLIRNYYQLIVRSDISVNDKELCLSVIFIIVHEYMPYHANYITDVQWILKEYVSKLNGLTGLIDYIYPTTLNYDLATWVQNNIPDSDFIIPHLSNPTTETDKFIRIFTLFQTIVDRLSS